MKNLWAIILVSSFATIANAIPHQVSSCSFPTMIRGEGGQTAYACGSYPVTVTVPDYYDTVSDLRTLLNKIQQLEARVKVLETKRP